MVVLLTTGLLVSSHPRFRPFWPHLCRYCTPGARAGSSAEPRRRRSCLRKRHPQRRRDAAAPAANLQRQNRGWRHENVHVTYRRRRAAAVRDAVGTTRTDGTVTRSMTARHCARIMATIRRITPIILIVTLLRCAPLTDESQVSSPLPARTGKAPRPSHSGPRGSDHANPFTGPIANPFTGPAYPSKGPTYPSGPPQPTVPAAH